MADDDNDVIGFIRDVIGSAAPVIAAGAPGISLPVNIAGGVPLTPPATTPDPRFAPIAQPGRTVGGQAGSPLPLGSIGKSAGGESGVPYSGSQAQLLDGLLSQLDSFATGSSGGGGGSNNGARAAAFNAQRDAQVNAYGQQINDLESQLSAYLAQVQELQKSGIQGINKQTQIAKTATRKERNTAEGTISQDLLGLLELLGQSQLATQAEGAATTQAIGNRAQTAQEAQLADTQRFAALGGGDRLAAAALEGQDTSRQLSSIDQALAARLSQAATADSNRRQGSARQVASGANQNLAANAAQILSQITAQAAGQRSDLRQSFGERKLAAQESYAQRISDARFAQSQAAAQRYIPTATSGGGGSSRLLPSQQLAQAQVQSQIDSILNPPSAVDQFLGGVDFEALFGAAAQQAQGSVDSSGNVVSAPSVSPILDVIRAADSIRG